VLVVERDGGYAGLSDVVVDLRVDDHPTPIEELRRIHDMHRLLFGQTPKEEWLDVDEELGQELGERLARLGYEGDLETALFRWGGQENLEERIDGALRVSDERYLDPAQGCRCRGRLDRPRHRREARRGLPAAGLGMVVGGDSIREHSGFVA
jgi:hypothetical protein